MNRCPECGGRMTLDDVGEHCEICEPEIESRADDLVDPDDEIEFEDEEN